MNTVLEKAKKIIPWIKNNLIFVIECLVLIIVLSLLIQTFYSNKVIESLTTFTSTVSDSKCVSVNDGTKNLLSTVNNIVFSSANFKPIYIIPTNSIAYITNTIFNNQYSFFLDCSNILYQKTDNTYSFIADDVNKTNIVKYDTKIINTTIQTCFYSLFQNVSSMKNMPTNTTPSFTYDSINSTGNGSFSSLLITNTWNTNQPISLIFYFIDDTVDKLLIDSRIMCYIRNKQDISGIRVTNDSIEIRNKSDKIDTLTTINFSNLNIPNLQSKISTILRRKIHSVYNNDNTNYPLYLNPSIYSSKASAPAPYTNKTSETINILNNRFIYGNITSGTAIEYPCISEISTSP